MSGDLQPNSTGLYTHYKDFLLKGGMTIPNIGSWSTMAHVALCFRRRFWSSCWPEKMWSAAWNWLRIGERMKHWPVIFFDSCCSEDFSFCFQIIHISWCVSCLRIFNTQIPTHWCFFSTDGTSFKGRECFVWKDRQVWWFVVCRKRNGIQRGFPSHWGWACIWVLMFFDIPTKNLEIKLSEK